MSKIVRGDAPKTSPPKFIRGSRAASEFLFAETGCFRAPSVLDKLRLTGEGPPYHRDRASGEITYRADDLLAFGRKTMAGPFRSTSEYPDDIGGPRPGPGRPRRPS